MRNSSNNLDEMMLYKQSSIQNNASNSPDKHEAQNKLRQNQLKFVTLAADSLSN